MKGNGIKTQPVPSGYPRQVEFHNMQCICQLHQYQKETLKTTYTTVIDLSCLYGTIKFLLQALHLQKSFYQRGGGAALTNTVWAVPCEKLEVLILTYMRDNGKFHWKGWTRLTFFCMRTACCVQCLRYSELSFVRLSPSPNCQNKTNGHCQ